MYTPLQQPNNKQIKLYTRLSKIQRELYSDLLSNNIDLIISEVADTTNKEATSKSLNICVYLRKICNHPYLINEDEEQSSQDHLIINCGKLVVLDKLLAKLKQEGSKVLIFSQMNTMLDILEDYMLYREYKYERIDGNTISQDRDIKAENFNNPSSNLFTFILSTRSGGVDLTLHAADVIIFYDSDWNSQMDIIAQNRVNKAGEPLKSITVYRLVTENSMEEELIKVSELIHLQKQQQTPPQVVFPLSPQMILDIIKFGSQDILQSKTSTILEDEDIDSIIKRSNEKTININK